MRDRLIELLQEFTDNNNGGGSNHGRADYLLENGVIVPPCKVGDTVYYIGGIHNSLVKEAKVEEIYCGEAGFAFHLCCDYTYFTLQQEEVFYTKEEAEAKLKGGEG